MKMSSMKIGLLAALACICPATALASGAGAESDVTHRAMMLVIQLGLILFAARLGNILFQKIRLPGALGELAAGVVIGPFALGALCFYGFPDGLFGTSAGDPGISPELYGLSAIAAVVLMFNVGLETDLKLLLRYALAGGLVGLGGMVASFFLGAGSVVVFSRALFGRPLGLFAPPCLLLGTITTATSVGITARILSENRKLDSPEGVTILSAAVVDDVLGIILLAVVMSVVAASRAAGEIRWSHVAIVGAKAVGVWLAATAIALAASRRVGALLKWFGEPTSIAIMALGLALILAGVFEEAGLAMIIGAYVMGLSLSRADISRVITERLRTVHALLVPVFFCVIGMQINLAFLGSSGVLVFALAYAAAALTAKVVGCGLPALLANFNLRGAARIGFGMAPRCEVALIIAGIGLSTRLGDGTPLLSQQIFSAVILMIVVNTVVAPPIMAMLFRSPARGTRSEVPDRKNAVQVPFEFPSIEMIEFFAGKLIAVFESEGFFVHRLSSRRPIYQLRKDAAVIDFRYGGARLTFHCDQRYVRLVNAAMYEALAAMEQAVRGLKKPLDSKAIRAGLQDAGPLGPQTLHMKQYLSPRLIEPKLRGTTKAEIINELLEIFRREGRIADVDAARQAVWKREESMSTGLQFGVAIPHGKTDTVKGLVCAVGIKADGVDFDALDSEPSRIFILTLSPAGRPAPHIQFMSTVSQILNKAGRQRVLEARSRRQIYAAFTAPLPETAPARRPPAAPVPGKFDPADYLRPELIEPDLKGATREEVIHELIALLDAAGSVRDVQAATGTVLDREAQMPTGMAEGLAVPHGRTDAVDSLVCAVGVHRAGVDFGAADGKAAHIVVLVLTPEGGADPYLQFIASLMGTLDGPGRKRVLAAPTRGELHAALMRRTTA